MILVYPGFNENGICVTRTLSAMLRILTARRHESRRSYEHSIANKIIRSVLPISHKSDKKC
jgi:hypothetical protein